MIFIGIKNLDGEVWKPVKGFDRYFISSMGRVVSCRKNKPVLMTPEIDKDGYLRIKLRKFGKYIPFVVSRLVCYEFNGAPETSDLVCCHRDNNKKNNVPSNLRWGTQKSNIEDKHLHGTHQIGETHPRSKITSDIARSVKKELDSYPKNRGKVLHTSLVTGVSYSIVADISAGKTWRHV